MRLIIAVFGLLLSAGGPELRAERNFSPRECHGEAVAVSPVPPESSSPERDLPSSPRASRHRPGDNIFRQFRREVREMGEEIRGNVEQIRALEEELSALEPGPRKDGLEERLASLRRRQAELRLELARKKVAFTIRSLEIAEERHQRALAGLEEVRESVIRDYPDLADLPPVE